MEEEKKQLWTGGLWEHDASKQPLPPPVVIPKVQRTKAHGTRLTLGTKLAFGGFLTLILMIMGLSAVVGVGNYQKSGDNALKFPDFFSWYKDNKEEAESTDDPKENELPKLLSAPNTDDVQLEFVEAMGEPLSPQEIYEKTMAAIVFVEVKTIRNKYATGTGVMMSEDGYLITNAHVIEGAVEATITFYNNEKYTARLVGYDFGQDLAVLKIDAYSEDRKFPTAEFSDSDLVKVGDLSYAIGNPLGSDYRLTFTDGMISAVNRVLQVENKPLILLQTTAPINSGNSGGALLNEYGQVVGITTIKIMSDEETIEGMGLALPSKRVQQVVQRLLRGESIEETQIGITIQELQFPNSGLEIIDVAIGTPAYDAGLRQGDVIFKVNDCPVNTIKELEIVKAYLFVGDTVEYTLYRDKAVVTVLAELQVKAR